jgi:acetyltransferase
MRLMEGEVLADNSIMIALMRRLDFNIRTRPGDEGVVWVGREI